MHHTVLSRGNPVELQGPELKPGDIAPSKFTLTANDMKQVTGSDLAGKPRIVLCSPSLDTSVCDLEARRFNAEAASLSGVRVYYVTMDLPFAQARWCGAAGVENVKTLSDYRERSFGPAYGVLMPNALLARAVFVIGADDRLRHVEYVKEVTTEPDYAAALAAIRLM